MILTKTPFRISFFGGGTDYPGWARREGGAVLSTTIDKYCYLSVRKLPPFYSTRYRIVWSHIENVSSINEILHPCVRACLKKFGYNGGLGLEIHHQGDLPARSGMGSSSAFAVGLLKGLHALHGEIIGKHELALEAIHLEQNIMKDNVGSQDQVAVAYGGLNTIQFIKNGDIRVEPVTISDAKIEELESHLLLVFTGTSRLSSEVAGEVMQNLDKKDTCLHAMKAMVDQAVEILAKGDLDDFGRLLHEAWMKKRELASGVSSPEVDRLYETALKHGALGGKLLGAGGSGFVLLYVPTEKREEIKEALFNYLQVPFKFESEGSTIIHYRNEENGNIKGNEHH